ncbi:hypothetical protein JTB14_007149 [Gonioctena quinquepunctata]|nr:hypothetical protein JTB14_007149 [Gonioctena quinquepunctata]
MLKKTGCCSPNRRDIFYFSLIKLGLFEMSGGRVFVPAKNVDGEWRLWWNLFNSNRSFFNNFTSKGDLFDAPIHFALAHCVLSDFNMSRGIARTFKLKYKGVEQLLQQNQKRGVAKPMISFLFHNSNCHIHFYE